MEGHPETAGCLLVIFGATGDLTRCKLAPAIWELARAGDLPKNFAILGVARSKLEDTAFRERLAQGCRGAGPLDPAAWSDLARRIHYHAADAAQPEGWEGLIGRIRQVAQEWSTGPNLLFYLALAPSTHAPVLRQIQASGLVVEGKQQCSLDRKHGSWQRVIVEKPFGSDLRSARALNGLLEEVFDPSAIYRIDHYLGKETVQNLVALRFANSIFEPIWNRRHVAQVQITAAETAGVEGRAATYEGSGALRDMIQSHLLQLMALVAMEPPNSLDENDLRLEQRKVLEAIRPPTHEEVQGCSVRGRYRAGQIQGNPVLGYLEEPGVAADSTAETYAALRLGVENWRWEGVPFYLRSGKRMNRKLTQILLEFRPAPRSLFGSQPAQRPNRLVINVQPEEGISLQFLGKVPGRELAIRPVVLDFDYINQFGGSMPEPYAHLLLDAMQGEHALFKSSAEIEAAWRILQPVLDHWKDIGGRELWDYTAGGWGPAEADVLLAPPAHWHNPEGSLSRRAGEQP